MASGIMRRRPGIVSFFYNDADMIADRQRGSETKSKGGC